MSKKATNPVKKIRVGLGKRAYDIIIGEDILDTAWQYIKTRVDSKHFIIITDENVPEIYIKKLGKSIEAGCQTEPHVITGQGGEEMKSFEGLEALLNEIFETNPERKTTLVALGGGVIGDLTGFAASILLRGINFIQVPTTLLAQVDSSVGGKTGINNSFGKNLIGSFYQPGLVLADMETLASLPRREFLAGYAEVVKYGLINDKAFFNWLNKNLGKVLAKERKSLKYIVEISCKAKADIVAKDEKESGIRALLNLGHTFGHALEQQTGYDGRLLHGEAVSIGIVFAFELSRKLGLCNKKEVEIVKTHLKKAGLPVSPLDIKDKWKAEKLMDAMLHDKKVSDGKMVFILTKGIGKAFIKKDVARADIFDTIKHILQK